MNKTEHFFKEAIDKNDRDLIVKSFTDLYCNGGYDLILQDAAEILDVEPKWLIRNFGDKFDYIIPPTPGTKSFTDYIDDKMMIKLGREDGESMTDFLYRSHIRRRGYARKKVFINRKSFYAFLNGTLSVTLVLKQVAIPRADLYNLSNTQLDKVRDEMLLQLGYASKTENGNLVFNEQSGVRIDDEQFDSALEVKMLSQRTLSSGAIATRYENPYQSKRIGDKKFREWLMEVNVTKVTFKPDRNERPVVRYLFESTEELKESLNLLDDRGKKFRKENYVFNIPFDMDFKDVKSDFKYYLEFLIGEGIVKLPKNRKSK